VQFFFRPTGSLHLTENSLQRITVNTGALPDSDVTANGILLMRSCDQFDYKLQLDQKLLACCITFYDMNSSVSGQDEPNLAL